MTCQPAFSEGLVRETGLKFLNTVPPFAMKSSWSLIRRTNKIWCTFKFKNRNYSPNKPKCIKAQVEPHLSRRAACLLWSYPQKIGCCAHKISLSRHLSLQAGSRSADSRYTELSSLKRYGLLSAATQPSQLIRLCLPAFGFWNTA